MAATLQYQLHEQDNGLYLCLEGDLDDNSFLTLSRALSEHKLRQPVKVDLGGIRFASSTGLRALVLLQQQVHDAGLEFTLLEPSQAVQRLFRSTGLSEVFDVSTDDPKDPC